MMPGGRNIRPGGIAGLVFLGLVGACGTTSRAAILAEAPDIRQVAVSPNGQWVIFGDIGAQDILKSVRLDGSGPVIDLGPASITNRGGRNSISPKPPAFADSLQRVVYTRWLEDQFVLVSRGLEGEDDPLVLSAGLEGTPSHRLWALSSDGTHVVWMQNRTGTNSLHVAPIVDPAGERRLDDELGVRDFQMSSASDRVVFWGGSPGELHGLFTVPIDQSEPVAELTLTAEGERAGLMWLGGSRDRPPIPLFQTSASGDVTVFVGRRPADTRGVVFASRLDDADPPLVLADLNLSTVDTSVRSVTISANGAYAAYQTSGNFVRNLWLASTDTPGSAVRIDPVRGEVSDLAWIRFTKDGSHLLFTIGREVDGRILGRSLMSVPTDLSESPVTLTGSLSFLDRHSAVSPDSIHIVFAARPPDGEDFFRLWSAPVEGGSLTDLVPLGINSTSRIQFRLTPDSRHVVFNAILAGDESSDPFTGVFAVSITGGEPLLLSDAFPAETFISELALTPDGQTVLFVAHDPVSGLDFLHAIPIPQPATLTLGAFALMMSLRRRRS